MKKIWGFNLKFYNIFLILAMAIANILLHFAAQYLNANHVPMPLWLDCVGTIVAAIEAGPIAGALAGLPVYGIYIFTKPDWTLFTFNSVLIGITAGIFTRMKGIANWKNVVQLGLILAFIDIVLASIIDQLLYNGLTGYALADMVFTGLSQSIPLEISSIIAESVMSIPDKIISVLLAYKICSSYSLDRTSIPASGKLLNAWHE